MSQIGTLAAGPAVETTINLQFVPEFIFVVDAYASQDLTAISWNVAGKELVNVSGGTNECEAFAGFAKYGDFFNQIIQRCFQTGFGYIPNQQFQLRMTNNNVGARAVYAFSRNRGNGKVITSAQSVVLANASQRFENFVGLQFSGANVTRADINFRDAKTKAPFNDSFTVPELEALLGLDQNTNDGGIGGQKTIDNRKVLSRIGAMIESVTLYTNANVTVNVIGLTQL